MTGSTLELPEGVRRLFPHHDVAELGRPEHRPFLLERLLEDGDSTDLCWLIAALGEGEPAAWLAGPGAGKLSGRSAAFWSLVLGVDVDRPPLAEAVWPL